MSGAKDNAGRESPRRLFRDRRLDHVERIYFLATASPWGNLQPMGSIAEGLGRDGPAARR